MKFFKIVFFVFITLTTIHCYNTTLQIHDSQYFTTAESEPEQTYKQGGYLLGLINSFDTPEIQCSEGKPEILILRNVWDNVIHWTIGGIYTQRTVQIFCKKETVNENTNQEGPG
ncbi:LA_3781 family PerA/PerB upregulated protein [Leptospira noguchii]|uniref:LA_3781 family PerA/PerB upregulated protein n=1 Tax=Leptospira noguchii TaxID=28182 RepID=UPI0011473AE1|nr:hypothetical protein [Leptospira noguchii]TQE73267.1 hypothetical protein FF021_12630 [Leptospira noguchii]UOG33708.1 hypothetical protein MAL02_14070 [Leptospira noguchii]UOG44552.1 hypothetical protein MAL01_14340 [Leptospira noguchii]UOG52099.1 hypothetical protein MAL09_15935 [Leptospira noguchii]